MRYKYIFLILLPISIIAKCDFSKIISNVQNNDYTKAFAFFSDIKQQNAKYWYFYGCLCHKQLINNLLSDDVDEYFNKTLSSYKHVFNFHDSKYIQYTEENLAALYNLYMLRGIAYLKRKLNIDALKCFRHADIIVPNAQATQLKILYTNILQNINVDISDIGNVAYEHLSLYMYISKKNYDKALEKIKSILKYNKYDLFAWLSLYKIKDSIDIKNQYSDKFYYAMMCFFDNNFKKAYAILKNLSVNDIGFKRIYCAILYKYCQEIQTNSNNHKLFSKLAHKCISVCKGIFYQDHESINILKTIYFLYMSLGDVNIADDIIKYHKVKI